MVIFRCKGAALLRLYVTALVLAPPAPAAAQEYDITTYNRKHGLAGSQVYAVREDSYGYLWIATYGGGISRFDGKNFENFTKKDGLAGDIVMVIYEDTARNLWFGTYDGRVSRYDGRGFRNFTLGDGRSERIVYDIAEDRHGNLLFATYGGGVFVLSGDSIVPHTEINRATGSLNTWALERHPDGSLWIGTGRGIFVYDEGIEKHFTAGDGLRANIIWSLCADSKGNMWAGSYDGGVYLYDGTSFTDLSAAGTVPLKTVYAIAEGHDGAMWFASDSRGAGMLKDGTFRQVREENGLAYDRVRALAADAHGNIWIGTDGGLSRYSGTRFTTFGKQAGLADIKVLSVYSDSRHTAWLGTFSAGVYRLSFRDDDPLAPGRLEHYDMSSGLPDNRVWCILEDRRGAMWFGTANGLARMQGGTMRRFGVDDGLANPTIYALLEDSAGNIWVASDGGVSVYNGSSFVNYSTDDGLPHRRVRSLLQTAGGTIWAGTHGGGVARSGVPDTAGKITFRALPPHPSLDRAIVYSMACDRTGGLWFSTYGEGVVHYNPATSAFATVTENDGLPDEAAMLVHADKDDGLWIGTVRALSRMRLGSYYINGRKIITRFGAREGFHGVECHQAAAWTDHLGHTWFGTISGAVRYAPGHDKLRTDPPRLYLQGIRLFFQETDLSPFCDKAGTATSPPEGLRLPFDRNHVTFDFIGIDLSQPDKVVYRFMLEGLDKDWLPETPENYATYANLPPGDYLFQVIACNADGTCSKKPVVMSFTVLPPWWQTWWSYLAASLLFFGAIYGFIRNRTRRLEKISRYLEDEVRQRTSEIVRQKELLEKKNEEKAALLKEIHHRVKNNMQVISSLLSLQANAINDPKVTEALEQGQDRIKSMAMVHQMLYRSEDPGKVDVRKYIEDLYAHMAGSHDRPGRRVTCSVSVDPISLDADIAIPIGLILNELISNSFKYAFGDGREGQIGIRLRRDNGHYTLTYRDNGPGLPDPFDFDRIGTLGLELVQAMAGQIGAAMTHSRKDGAAFSFTFEAVPKAEEK